MNRLSMVVTLLLLVGAQAPSQAQMPPPTQETTIKILVVKDEDVPDQIVQNRIDFLLTTWARTKLFTPVLSSNPVNSIIRG